MNLFNKKYQIFVSSTYTDLIKAREEVTKLLLSLYQIPIGMEMFSADNEEQWSTIKTTIEQSDYYLLILGHRYGSVTPEGISYTEKEFDFAKENGIPIIAFVKNRNAATTPSERDTEHEKTKSLEAFYDKVINNAMCDFWSNENELAQKVSVSLIKIIQKTPRVGWVRADQAASPKVSEEIALLSNENRDLKAQLAVLSSSKQPYVDVEINEQKSLEFFIPEKVGVESDYAQKAHKRKGMLPEREEYIDSYNLSINENITIANNYNTELNTHLRLNEAIDLAFKVENIGTAKATDIYIDIIFPKEVIVVKKGDSRIHIKPNWPTILLEHPAIIPDSHFYQSSISLLGRMSYRKDNLLDVYPNISNIKSIIQNPNYWTKLNDNKITIKVNSLLHTRTMSFDDEYLIAALEIGECNIQVSVICAEFTEPALYTIPVSVRAKI